MGGEDLFLPSKLDGMFGRDLKIIKVNYRVVL